ncbi:Hypothetical predicted protein [Olea europaea subsp. europaea]|uniref:Uncharacterized protein n=1 Tax=Olea europaea subsp. europaea TaxID=158383 RepID=A0A8S0QBH1_OLEEU|nr:Hypothetical predicted protein [Olea europaea subsp. europaea]
MMWVVVCGVRGGGVRCEVVVVHNEEFITSYFDDHGGAGDSVWHWCSNGVNGSADDSFGSGGEGGCGGHNDDSFGGGGEGGCGGHNGTACLRW